MSLNILMLDPEEGALHSLIHAFRDALGREAVIHTVLTVEELERSLRSDATYHLAVVDLELGDGTVDGLGALRRIRTADVAIPAIAVAGRGDVATVANAVAAGATDFLVRGAQLGDRVATLLGKLRPVFRLVERSERLQDEAERRLEAERARHRIVGVSSPIQALLDQIRRVASIPRPVLIVGERGTGKELVARALHELSDAAGPIVTVNCAAFSDALLESELFGHERGSFTGAERTVRGKFELASEGTLFLDEIGCMSLAFQQKILRVVEYGVFLRVGGSVELRTSARIVAATNADLEAKIASGEFLRDLHDRIAFEVLRVPPLRDRGQDVELLAQHFLDEFMREVPSMRGKHLTAPALAALRGYRFPGNVRELKTIIERAAYRDENNEIVPEELGLPTYEDEPAPPAGFEARVAQLKRRLIEEALRDAGGNQAHAARLLGLSYHQFRHHYRRAAEE